MNRQDWDSFIEPRIEAINTAADELYVKLNALETVMDDRLQYDDRERKHIMAVTTYYIKVVDGLRHRHAFPPEPEDDTTYWS